MNNRRWGQGGCVRGVYKYEHDKHKHRMGSCEWLPKDGDLCVCVGHSGDCFSDYVVMRKTEDSKFKMIGGKFGAYNFAEPEGVLPKREYHLLQAGEPINYSEAESLKAGPDQKDGMVEYIITSIDGNYWRQDGPRPGYWIHPRQYDKRDATQYTLKEAEAKAEELSADHYGVRILALIYLRKDGKNE